ncbi:PilZ domain-containing protein [Vibrio sp. WXL103]|uniref:PilZ domain-containing protein n=1 Tax=Vibrio sp. WXL103 TaxID=3450710 RepID=UPI003EC69438
MPDEPIKSQASGVAVQLKQPGWFSNKLLGRAVIKDISLGGAGILVSNRVEVPKNILIETSTGHLFNAEVVYQRDEGELFTFLGVLWTDNNDEARIELIEEAQELTNTEPRNENPEARVESRESRSE